MRASGFAESLSPRRDESGRIVEISPQHLYEKADICPLHEHGHGTFCKFSISAANGLVGVYALIVGESVHYIGECADFRKRFNMGYGNISPKSCYKGGQPTNCKINRRVLDVTRSGGRVDLYFYSTDARKSVERELVTQYLPPWNGRQQRIIHDE